MKMVQSTDSAAVVLNELIQNVNYVLGKTPEDENSVTVASVKGIVVDPKDYRDYVIKLRNQAIAALTELGIHHDHTPEATDIGPTTA